MSGNEEEETGGADEANTPPLDNDTTDTPPTTNTGTQRTPSALHNRLLNQQRSNILLQVLFHHMLNSRRRREEEEALALSPPPLPDRDMPVLSHNDATAMNAICRFCFEGSAAGPEEEEEEGTDTSTASTTNNNLVAPCNCAGGSRWVHLDCLRQWQRLQARNLSEGAGTTYTAAGYICNVCNSPYLSRPPALRSVRRNLLKRGTLLVSKPNVGRTFQKTVVLLLSDVCGNHNGAFGLIVNSPLQEEFTPNNLLQSTATMPSEQESTEENNVNSQPSNNNNANTPVIEWRRGGPVCGGRLGVVHYTVLHTFPPSLDLGGHLDDVLDVDIDEEYIDLDENEEAEEEEIDLEAQLNDNEGEDRSHQEVEEEEDDEIEEEHGENEGIEGDAAESDSCAPLSLPVFDVTRNTPPLQYVASPYSSTPSTFSEDSLGHTVQRLVQNRSAALDTQDERASNEDNEDNDNTEPTKVIVFSGYCKWRSGQLEREIQREVWDVCIDATPEDILRHHGSGFWEEISESNRLLSWQRLIEEGENETETDD